VSASAVQYLTPPTLTYPLQSKRLRESGQVTLRVLIESNGRPSRIEVHATSGYQRLDDAAVAAMRTARFKPYMENGQPLAVWVQTPIRFDLEN
jgi:protein TonB